MVEVKSVSYFFDFLLKKDSKGAIEFLNQLLEKGIDLEEFSKVLINYLRQILILKIMGTENNPFLVGFSQEEIQKMKEQSEKISQDQLNKLLQVFLEAQNKIKFSPIPQLPLELAIVETCSQ